MNEMPKLTDRQQQILDLVQSAIERTGAPPTRAEIANELGFRSANAAEEHLQALARKGVIELIGGTSRGIRLQSDTLRALHQAREQARLHQEGAVDVFLGQDRAACRHPADQRQRQLRQARQRQRVLLASRLVQGAQRVRLQAYAARRAADQLDHAFARERLQVLLGCVRRAKAELVGDLGARGRRPGAFDRALDEIEDLLLTIGELGRFLHGTSWVRRAFPVTAE